VRTVPDPQTRAEVEKELQKPFDEVKSQLEELFDAEWDDVLVIIETSVTKSGRSRAEVIIDLVEKATEKPGVQTKVKRGIIRWIGKPWRERENPWDRFKHRVPPPPPRTDDKPEDLDEWTPLKPDDEEQQ
jgi:hypothetical protein